MSYFRKFRLSYFRKFRLTTKHSCQNLKVYVLIGNSFSEPNSLLRLPVLCENVTNICLYCKNDTKSGWSNFLKFVVLLYNPLPHIHKPVVFKHTQRKFREREKGIGERRDNEMSNTAIFLTCTIVTIALTTQPYTHCSCLLFIIIAPHVHLATMGLV